MSVSPDEAEFDTIIEDGGQPEFSPNGRHVAFIRTRREMTWPGDLWVGRADGTGQRLLYRPETSASSPSWSPDGSQIVFVVYTGIVMINADGTGFRQVLDDFDTFGDCMGAHDPEWSPHGDRIAFTTRCQHDDAASSDEIWSVRPDGTDLQRLIDVASVDVEGPGDVTWSPDGGRIAFHARPRDPDSDTDAVPRGLGIWVMNADGSDPQEVVTGSESNYEPDWSPDGRQLVFTRSIAEGGNHLYRIRPDGTGATRISYPPSPVRHFAPNWQPVRSYTDMACPADKVPPADFDDVAGTHAAAVDCAVWHGLAHGRTASTYEPGQPVRRDQMASFVARLLEQAGVELPKPTSQGFIDIDGNTHADAINQLAELGIVHGTDGSRYAPAQPVTRAQMASFLVRGYEHATDSDLPQIFDEFVDDNGSTHEAAIDRTTFAGFAAGTSVSRFTPGDPVRRDQMATFLVRVADRLIRDGAMRLPA